MWGDLHQRWLAKRCFSNDDLGFVSMIQPKGFMSFHKALFIPKQNMHNAEMDKEYAIITQNEYICKYELDSPSPKSISLRA